MILTENKFFCTYSNIYDYMKTCCECEIEKNEEYFSKNKNLKDGINNRCKVCCSNRNKNRYKNNKNKIKQQTNLYYYTHKEIILEKQKQKPSYHKINPKYYLDYRKNNLEKQKQYYKQWREKNANIFRLRIQIWGWLKKKGIEKTLKTKELLGYNFNQFEEKIGNPLPNQQLDHKIPLSWFIDETPVNILFNLENLHYIDEKINKTKSNSYCDKVNDEYKQLVLKYIKPKYKNKL